VICPFSFLSRVALLQINDGDSRERLIEVEGTERNEEWPLIISLVSAECEVVGSGLEEGRWGKRVLGRFL
jgi:hypothetical protein